MKKVTNWVFLKIFKGNCFKHIVFCFLLCTSPWQKLLEVKCNIISFKINGFLAAGWRTRSRPSKIKLNFVPRSPDPDRVVRQEKHVVSYHWLKSLGSKFTQLLKPHVPLRFEMWMVIRKARQLFVSFSGSRSTLGTRFSSSRQKVSIQFTSLTGTLVFHPFGI